MGPCEHNVLYPVSFVSLTLNLNLNLNDYVEVHRSLVLYDVGGCANYQHITVLNELTDAE